MMRSAASMTCASCSTTSSVLPASRSFASTSMMRPMSRGCRPIARLVEHEQRVHERRAERRRQVDALHFAARQRARLPVERQIARARRRRDTEAAADLAEHELGRVVERLRQLDRSKNSSVRSTGSIMRSCIVRPGSAANARRRRSAGRCAAKARAPARARRAASSIVAEPPSERSGLSRAPPQAGHAS